MGTSTYKTEAVGETSTAHTAGLSKERGTLGHEKQFDSRYSISLYDLLTDTSPLSSHNSDDSLPLQVNGRYTLNEVIGRIKDICTFYETIPDPIVYRYRSPPYKSIIFKVALHQEELQYDRFALLSFKAPVDRKAHTAAGTHQRGDIYTIHYKLALAFHCIQTSSQHNSSITDTSHTASRHGKNGGHHVLNRDEQGRQRKSRTGRRITITRRPNADDSENGIHCKQNSRNSKSQTASQRQAGRPHCQFSYRNRFWKRKRRGNQESRNNQPRSPNISDTLKKLRRKANRREARRSYRQWRQAAGQGVGSLVSLHKPKRAAQAPRASNASLFRQFVTHPQHRSPKHPPLHSVYPHPTRTGPHPGICERHCSRTH